MIVVSVSLRMPPSIKCQMEIAVKTLQTHEEERRSDVKFYIEKIQKEHKRPKAKMKKGEICSSIKSMTQSRSLIIFVFALP